MHFKAITMPTHKNHSNQRFNKTSPSFVQKNGNNLQNFRHFPDNEFAIEFISKPNNLIDRISPNRLII